MRAHSATLAACMFVLTACVTAPLPERPPGELFRGVEAPPTDSARVYIFRPGFSRVSERDSPSLFIDGNEVVRLSIESYTDVIAKPGTYTVSLKPNAFESGVWSGTWRMTVEPDRVYFLAVWNTLEHFSSFTLAPMPGGAFLFLPTSEVRNKELRFEPVSQSDALPVISALTYVRPAFPQFEPAP